MKIWVSSVHGFPVAPFRAVCSYDRAGLVLGLRDLGAEVSVACEAKGETITWLKENKIGYEPTAPAKTKGHVQGPDALLIEGFSGRAWYQPGLRRVYDLLASFHGPVVYAQFDFEFYLSLEPKTVQRWTGKDYDWPDLTDDKTYLVTAACQDKQAFIDKCISPKRLADASWKVVQADIRALALPFTKWLPPVSWPTYPKKIAFFGKDSPYRMKILANLIKATPPFEWDLYGKWKHLPARAFDQKRVWQADVSEAMRKYPLTPLVYRHRFQIDSKWRVIRELESFQAGVATLIPADSPLVEENGCEPEWLFQSPEEFGAKALDLLRQPKLRSVFANAQQEWAKSIAPPANQGAKDILKALKPYLAS